MADWLPQRLLSNPEACLFFPFSLSFDWCPHLVCWTFCKYFLGVRLALADYHIVALVSQSPLSVLCTCRQDYPVVRCFDSAKYFLYVILKYLLHSNPRARAGVTKETPRAQNLRRHSLSTSRKPAPCLHESENAHLLKFCAWGTYLGLTLVLAPYNLDRIWAQIPI